MSWPSGYQVGCKWAELGLAMYDAPYIDASGWPGLMLNQMKAIAIVGEISYIEDIWWRYVKVFVASFACVYFNHISRCFMLNCCMFSCSGCTMKWTHQSYTRDNSNQQSPDTNTTPSILPTIGANYSPKLPLQNHGWGLHPTSCSTLLWNLSRDTSMEKMPVEKEKLHLGHSHWLCKDPSHGELLLLGWFLRLQGRVAKGCFVLFFSVGRASSWREIAKIKSPSQKWGEFFMDVLFCFWVKSDLGADTHKERSHIGILLKQAERIIFGKNKWAVTKTQVI